MAATTGRAPIVTTSHVVRRKSDWKPRLVSTVLAALLLTVGIGRRRTRTGGPAETPVAAPVQKIGVKQFLLTLYREISNDRVLAISAGVTFYALLAIFPAIAAVVSIYGLFANATTIGSNVSSLATVLPGGAIDIVGDQIKRVVAKGNTTLGFTAIIGIAVSIWSANSGVKALFDALNIVLEEKETRGFIRLNAISLAFTFGAIVFILLAIGVVVAIPAFLQSVGWSHQLEWLIDIGRWPVMWAVIAVGIAFLYRFGPGRNDIPWRWISWGSAFAASAWLAASLLFSWYAANFGTYNKTYGSLGAVIGFMTWIWISVIVILVGEELNEIVDKLQNLQKDPEKARELGAPGKAKEPLKVARK
jgi:membrane protein